MSDIKQKPVRGSQKMPDHIMLSFSKDPKTSMTVTWRTCTDIKNGYVLYREEGSAEVKRADAVMGLFESDIDISHIFWATPENLKPGTKYYYTCGDDTHRSEEYYFTTEPENLTKFKFICIADHQKASPFDCPDYSELNKFLKDILKQHPDTRFILTGGDNTDCGQHEVQWNGMFSGLTGIIEYVPYMMCIGNHDNRGFKIYREHGSEGRFYSEPAEFFAKQFKGSYPDNGPENWKTENYAFDYGNVHFCVLGVNGPEEVNEWLIDDLNKTDKTWKVGVYHFPICYSGVENENYDAYPQMREGMEMLDILFSGHIHNFCRSFPLKNEELFDRPSQGTIHYMLGNAHNNPPGSLTSPKIWHAAFYHQEERNQMVTIVEVDGSKMTLTALLNDGRIADQCVIDKEKDLILPYALAPVFNQTRIYYKGMYLGLCSVTVPPVQVDGMWFIAFATLVGYIGGEVKKEKGKVTCSLYGHTATFFEDSDIALTDKGEVKMKAKVFRGHSGQLYVPLDCAAKIFEMRWAYAKRNNFISIEHESDSKTITVQP